MLAFVLFVSLQSDKKKYGFIIQRTSPVLPTHSFILIFNFAVPVLPWILLPGKSFILEGSFDFFFFVCVCGGGGRGGGS